MSGRAAINQRQDEVMRLRLRGLPVAVIADAVGVSTRSCERDLDALRQQHGEVFRKRHPDELLAMAEFAFKAAEQAAWRIHDDAAPGGTARVNALREVRRSINDRVRLLISAGILPRFSARPKATEPTRLADLDGFSEIEIDAIEQHLIGLAVTQPGHRSEGR